MEYRVMWRDGVEHGNESSSFIGCGEFLDELWND
jgi:hypothetical protein